MTSTHVSSFDSTFAPSACAPISFVVTICTQECSSAPCVSSMLRRTINALPDSRPARFAFAAEATAARAVCTSVLSEMRPAPTLSAYMKVA